MHKSYDAWHNFDIAVIRLAKPLVFNNYVQPVCLPTTPPEGGANCFAVGWGVTQRTSIEFT